MQPTTYTVFYIIRYGDEQAQYSEPINNETMEHRDMKKAGWKVAVEGAYYRCRDFKKYIRELHKQNTLIITN